MNKWANILRVALLPIYIYMNIVLDVIGWVAETLFICIDMSNTEFIEVLCVRLFVEVRLISADLEATLI